MLVKEMYSIEKNENGYRIKGDIADFQIIFLTDDLIRVRASFDRKFEEESYSLVLTAWEDRMDDLLKEERTRIQALDIPCKETAEEISFETKTLRLVLTKKPFGFSLYDLKTGQQLYKDLEERAFEQDHLGRVFHYSEMDREKDHFYGFGENTGKLDKKGSRMRLSPKDAIGHDPEFGGPLYKHIPFYIRINETNQHALGIFYNNTYEAAFDMGKEISGYWASYSYYEADGGDIDLFFVNGPSVAEVLDNYTRLTGRQTMATKQSLGFTASTMYYAELEENCDQEIYNVIDKQFDEKMYIDNFKLASGYTSGEKDNLRYTFNWNYKRFPDPDAFFKNMNDRGINVIPNIKPGVLANHPKMEEYKKNDSFVKTADGKEDYIGRWWGGAGRFVDFTNPAGRATWKKLMKESLLEKGVHTIWNDNCEYDGVEDRNARCDFEGKTGRMSQLRVAQANMMAYVAKEALHEVYPDRRPYVISRAGCAGIQRYAQTWAGDDLTDWRTPKFNVATIVNMGLSGVANSGCDIGGFAGGAPDGELLMRWIQTGIFQPRFCINSANNDNTVTQPWMYEENNDVIREAYRLRYQMLPYLYSLLHEAYETGKPVMRPLFMEFQNDINCLTDENYTFLFGPSILVANVFEQGATERTLYLPTGCKWYDMNNFMKEYEGGQTITIPVDRHSIPMFFREDGIFVTSNDVTHILRDTTKLLHLYIGAKGSPFSLYDDDGYSKKFEDGDYEKTTITVNGEEEKTIHFSTEGNYKGTVTDLHLSVLSKKRGAYWVTVDGAKIPRFLSKSDWEASSAGWYYNLSTRMVEIKTPKPNKKEFTIIVSTSKFDLIGMEIDI